MKDKIFKITSLVLFILLILCIGLLVFKNKPESNLNQYSCSNKSTMGETYYKLSYNETFESDLTGAVINAKSLAIYTYTDSKAYATAKESYLNSNDTKYTYEYNDSLYEIKVIGEGQLVSIKDELGVNQELWFKNYIKILEEQNYICEEIK